MKICIVGIGKLGNNIARALLDGGNEITIIDKDPLRIQTAGSNMDAYTIQGDALETSTLKELGIADHDMIVAVTEDDEKNIVICRMAKHLGCPKAIARIREPQHINQLDLLKEAFGIDQIVNPDYACAKEMFNYLTQAYSIEGGLFSQDGISICEMPVNKMPQLIGKSLAENADNLQGFLVAAISRNGKILIPQGGNKIEEGDILYLSGLDKDVFDLISNIQLDKKSQLPNRVMIAGGGKTGLFLAQMLDQRNIPTKIIEANLERCSQLASLLNNTVIINGNASDINILREEGLEGYDAFIAATGFDEENILLSLLVKQYGVKDVIAKASRDTFIPVVKNLGTTAIINPQQIIANNVLNYIRKTGIVLFSKVINGQAEFREIQAETTMPLTKKNLTDLEIPEGVIILTIHRGKNVIIPNGKTQIAPGDRVMLLSLLSSGGELESLLSKAPSSIM